MKQQVATVLLLSLLHFLALFLFCNGFLLTRVSLDNTSVPKTPPTQSTFSKVVILVIDALRYDFATPQNGSSPFWNHFPILAQHVDKSPGHAYLSKFIADPPTTTLQRLKGLTTGSLPTFIDASSNFAGDAITEDNLILQLRRAGKKIAFAGDDTWQALFPGAFESELNFPFESLNVWDLDTVDNGVHHHLLDSPAAFFSSTVRNKWDVVIAHALGLDHAGHRYGPNHEETTRKLQEMNSWIQEIITAIDEDTLFVVMGDHGMNPFGDHGGDSPEELEAALFMYSKRALFSRSTTDKYGSRGVAQIDLVPTLALLMGLPIPFNNLGSPIPQAFSNKSALTFESAISLCTEQIERYISVYVENSASIKQMLNTMNQDYDVRTRRSAAWQRDVLTIFRQQWAQYHMPSIWYSLLFVVSIIAFETGLFFSHSSSRILDVLAGSLAVQSTFFFQALKTLISDQARWLGIFSGLLILVLYLLVRPIDRRSVSELDTTQRDGFNTPDVVSILAIILHLGTFASNSFTIHEDRITLFLLGVILLPVLLGTFGLSRAGTRLNRLWKIAPVIGIMVLSRFASSVRLCREEQGQSCTSNFHTIPAGITFPLTLVLGLSVSQTFQACLNLEAQSLPTTRRWVYFSVDFILLLSWLHWLLDYLALTDLKLYIARTLLTCVSFAPLVWYKLPLPISFRVGNLRLVIDGADSVLSKSYLQLVLPCMCLFVFLSRAVGSVSILCLLLSLLCTRSAEIARVTRHSRIFSIVLPFELAFLHFFSTGHQMALPFIQWDLAFLASRGILYPLSPMLVIGNAFASFFVVALAIPVLTLWSVGSDSGGVDGEPVAEQDKSSSVTKAMVGCMTLHTLLTFSTMVFATHFRRHLMVWKIFAPRFMCAALIMLVTDATFLIASLALSLSQYKITELVKTIQGILPNNNGKGNMNYAIIV
ncbi:putative Phosphoethanolamine N-methyltransferase [Taphrina deformans PYCC 5710]|uniref:Phosphoethanolamine N-methyltransferase n=1 Tax=Taphrina deformans (strain PYCC 5710 / ATCC 11124 / CBS 356.35 / IMI 108563 / JCM 9778 / NBRC 8474) TaxID=1097556 RepID=R4X861_TAPDE|nr:putative Phosphoethanolamine N-methyltransferase [Taphrina deformans PYCC 5710]|eukprot:CCG81447.1 putative Phosphoethanolamine N-methyltransferase [Taphrina deformans PYCC 5710]